MIVAESEFSLHHLLTLRERKYSYSQYTAKEIKVKLLGFLLFSFIGEIWYSFPLEKSLIEQM